MTISFYLSIEATNSDALISGIKTGDLFLSVGVGTVIINTLQSSRVFGLDDEKKPNLLLFRSLIFEKRLF